MMRNVLTIAALLLLSCALSAQEAESSEEVAQPAEADEASAATSEAPNGDGIQSPKAMSGMSILGNEEAPKALVIVPWKSSELGETISLTDTLDDRAQPVDKEVFVRELRYYAIRSED